MLALGTAEVLLALVLQGPGADVHAQHFEPETAVRTYGGERRFTLDVINDSIATIYDEGYSSGLRLLLRTGPWFDALALSPHIIPAERRVAEYWTVGIAHEMWTPADLTADRVSLLQDDRPYAGLVSADTQVDLVLSGGLLDTGYTRLSGRIMVGATGDWSGSASIQRSWHSGLRRITGADYPKDPQGWDIYQVPNTVVVNLRFGIESEVVRVASQGTWGRLMGAPLGTRATIRADCDVGTFRVGCEGGLMLRMGWMPELTFDGATPIVESAQPTPLPISAHMIVGTRLGVVGFDALLDGPIGTDSPTASKRIVRARLEMGLLVQLWATELTYVYIIETNELSPLPYWAQPYQRMGHVKLSYRW